MTQRNNNSFELKDSVTLTLTYLLGIQLVVPLVIGLILPIIDLELYRQDRFAFFSAHAVLVQFLTFSVGTLWLVWRYYAHLEKAWERFKVNFIENMKLLAKYYFIAQALNIVISLILEFGFGLTASSENQQVVETLLQKTPVLMAIVTTIYAPIIEEIVFRGGLYLGIKETVGEKAASIISALLFGAVHVIPQLSNGSFVEVLYILPYAMLGYFMVKAVRETNSLFGGIIFHTLNNLIATILVMLIV